MGARVIGSAWPPANPRLGAPLGATEEGMLRTERSSFSLTMYADEACDPYTPREHVPRAPTIIWDPRETQPLLDLRSSTAPPSSLAGGLEPEPGDPHLDEEAEVGRVAHFHPTLAYALRRGPRGLGHAHAAPPPPEQTKEGRDGEGTKTAERLAFPHVTNRLTQVQLRLLDGQNSAARTSLRRVIGILRRRRRQRHEGTLTLLAFLRAFHTECGLRMVHLAFHCSGGGDGGGGGGGGGYDATAAYSLDQGGRFYVMIRWHGLGAPERGADPKVRVHSPADQYWGDARITPTSRIEFCRYACPCAVHTTAPPKQGATP